MPQLPKAFQDLYNQIKGKIEERLVDFGNVDPTNYFYELCFCICTPQSKASNALAVQKTLSDKDFLYNDKADVVRILNNPGHYIRFHNQKAKRLYKLKEDWPSIENLLNSSIDVYLKRNSLARMVNGIGMKEASHYLRNIGYINLAILDRHILRNLVECGVYESTPNISTQKRYEAVERQFLDYAASIVIPIDHLDLLFWSKEAGEIIK